MFDKWEVVEEALDQQGPRCSPLVVVCFAHAWNPPAMHVAKALDELRKATTPAGTPGDAPRPLLSPSQVRVLVVDAGAHPDRCLEHRVVATPAVVYFWRGQPIVLRRPGLSDDTKFVGSTTKQRLLSMVQLARDVGESGRPGQVLLLDF